MITTIDITLLPEPLQDMVLGWYRDAVKQEDHRMTFLECAWLYGYTYSTIRTHVCEKKIRTVGRWPNRRITHKAMREFIQAKKKPGTPRKALRAAQAAIG